MVEMKFNCPVSLAQMSETTSGFFCDSCDKEIVDYSGMSNEEIAGELKRQKKSSCGVIRSSQVVNSISSKFQQLFRMAFCAVILLGFSATGLLAQDSVAVAPENGKEITKDDIIFSNDELGEMQVITGTLKDHEGEPIVFGKVIVQIGDKRILGVSDFDGVYKVLIPTNIQLNSTLTIKVLSIGYEETIFMGFEIVETRLVHVFDLVLQEQTMMCVGVITMCKPPMDMSPYSFGKTVISGDDLRRMP